MNTSSISVIGTGSWGTALAQIMAAKGLPTTLWARREEIADEINKTRLNSGRLPKIKLHKNITATTDLQEALKNDVILIVTPAQALRPTLEQMKPHIRTDHVLILCSKGIEQETLLMMSEVVDDVVSGIRVAILSGPNFAKEIAIGKPAATTLACTDKTLAVTLQNIIASKVFRPYVTGDIIGTQIAGSIKNVIAIACGIANGLEMGESARASLVTRGLAELTRLGVAMGASPETFLGQCGVGDMMLTCSSEQSRNFSLGLALGKGAPFEEIMNASKSVTEGVHTAKTCAALAKKYGCDMPICTSIYACVSGDLSIPEALKSILNRPLKSEAGL